MDDSYPGSLVFLAQLILGRGCFQKVLCTRLGISVGLLSNWLSLKRGSFYVIVPFWP